MAWSARQFYIRRFLRIFPLYYVCLLGLYAVGRFGIREDFPWHFLYLSNVFFFLEGKFGGPFSHFWSLAVEEQFYLVWPWLIFCTPTKGRMIPVMIVALMILGPLSRGLLWGLGYTSFAQWNSLLFANLDTLGAGALLAWLRFAGADGAGSRRGLAWAAICALVATIALQRLSDTAAYAVWHRVALAVGCAFLVWGSARGFAGAAGRALAWAPLVHVGKISYGIYVFHMFAPNLAGGLFKVVGLPHSHYQTAGGIALMFFVTLLLAEASWHLYEYPLNRLKARFPYTNGRIRVPIGAGPVPSP